MDTTDHHLLGQQVIVKFKHTNVSGVLLEVFIDHWVRVRTDDGTVKPGYALSIEKYEPGVNCFF